MEELFKERKKKLEGFKKYLGRRREKNKNEVPDGLYTKCAHCGELILTSDLEKALHVCPKCGFHLSISAYNRLKMVCDDGKYKEYFKDLESANPLDFPEYKDKIQSLQKKTGLKDGVVIVKGSIHKIEAIICVMDNRFMMGSMGSVVGEKLTRAIEFATKKKLPLIIFTTSGGARMQEGIYSLMQMAKTCAALQRHSEAGLLYISYITHPTTGGVTASFASVGDIIIGEPQALIGFAGPRVIESTIKQKLPEDFQRTEFMLEKGFIDCIVERKHMKDVLGTMLNMHA